MARQRLLRGGRWALAALLVLGGRAPAQDGPTEGASGMTDDEFWTKPTKGYDALHDDVLDGHARFVIDAPKVVDLAARRSVPVPIFYALPARESWGVQLLRDATVIVSRLEDRACWAATVRRPEGDDDDAPDPADFVPPEGPPPDPDALDDQFLVTDLRQTPLIPWEPGTYEVRVVVRERTSNVVRTVLKGTGAPPAAKGPPAAAPAPGSPLPSYARRDDSPALPSLPGIAFEVPPQVAKDAAQALVRVSLRLPVLPCDRDASGAAFVPLHLVLVGVEDGESLLLRLRLPVAADGTGHATLDLLALHRPLREGLARTYLVRAVSGDVVAGPARLRLAR